MVIGEDLVPDLTNLTIRTAYAVRIAKFRATVSLAIATGVAMMLKYGVDHLSMGAVNSAATTRTRIGWCSRARRRTSWTLSRH
jgi:hypothetical protein